MWKDGFTFKQYRFDNDKIFLRKGAGTDMRYFARSKFSKGLVYKKNLSLIWQVVFQLGYIFCQER